MTTVRKPMHFRSKHIHIEIRPPTGKELDLDDEYDITEGMDGIYKEFLSLTDDVAAAFKIFLVKGQVVNETESEKMRRMFP